MTRRLLGILLAATFAAMPAAAKTLVFCSEGNPESVNGQLVTTSTGINAAKPIFNNLVEFAVGSTEPVPGLAERWTISQDGRDYLFHLRPNVQFHSNEHFTPTRPMTADDVVFSLMRMWKADHPFHGIGGGRYDYFEDLGMGSLLQSIEAVDEHTVHIRLARPEAPFLADLAMPFNVILSAEYADALMRAGTPERLDLEPIGTGPFAFDSFRKDIAIRYRAFARYWRGRQAIDTLVFSITPTPAARLAKLKAGECHVAAFPAPEDAAAIEANPDLRLYRQEGFNIGYLAINTTRKPFDDVRVRRALNLAIDKESILRAIYKGAGRAAKNPLPPTLWAYDDAIEPYPYDVEAARRLLTEAGQTSGLNVDLWYMPVSRPYNPDGKRMAEMIQADLEKLGIRSTLKSAEWSEYRRALQNGEITMALYGWTGDNGDPDNFMHTLLGCTAARIGGNNIARWCNADFDALVMKGKIVTDQAERLPLYARAQEIFHEEAPWVPIAHSVVMMAARSNVVGFKMDPLGRHVFEDVDLTDTPSR